MRLPQFHIDTICFITLLAAVDLVWYLGYVQHGWNYPSAFGFSDRSFDTSVMPMLNLLVVGLYNILFHRGRNPFLIGFVISGLVATMAFMVWVWIAPNSVAETLLVRPFPGLVWAVRQKRISIEWFITVGSAIDTSPQLLVALVGGWLSRWVATHRQTPDRSKKKPPSHGGQSTRTAPVVLN